MTREEFLNWAAAQGQRYKFDGFQPVAMTEATLDHSRIAGNIHVALCMRLYGAGFKAMGLDAGVATVGGAVRYPDALVTRSTGRQANHLVPEVVVVFEVLCDASGHTDRIQKLIEYQTVPSICHYVMLEDTSVGLVALSRTESDAPWTATALIDGDILRMPEIGIEIPIAEFYEGTDLLNPIDFGPGGGTAIAQ